MQTASAFGSVQRCAVVFRLGLPDAGGMALGGGAARRVRDGDRQRRSAGKRQADRRSMWCRRPAATKSICSKLLVRLPNGSPLVSADGFSLRSNERTLVTGPSGAGKSTLFRAIAGIWPFGTGSIAIPAKATLMMLPQRPYFPIGSLQAAIVYPAEASAYRFGPGQGCSRSRWACPSSHRGWKRTRTGTECFRSANNSGLGSPGRCCMRRNICSSMRRPRRSMKPRRRRSTVCSRRNCRPPPSSRSVTADARGLPSAQCRAGPRRRPVRAAGPGRPNGRASIAGHRSPVDKHPASENKRGGRLLCRPPCSLGRRTYFRLVIAVRSAESLTMPAAPHQFEPAPPGLIGVTLVVPEALKALVKALQLPFDRSVSE